MSKKYLFKNARIVDGSSREPTEPTNVAVEGEIIKEVGPKVSFEADIVDVKGQTLMPGLIDCHVHVIAVVAGLAVNAKLPDSLVTARSIARPRRLPGTSSSPCSMCTATMSCAPIPTVRPNIRSREASRWARRRGATM